MNNKTKNLWQMHLKKFEHNSNFYLGKSWSNSFEHDPKTLLFNLSRYKFVSKMLTGLSEVLEVGCGEAMGSPLVSKEVKNLFCVDIPSPGKKNKIKDNSDRLKIFKNMKFIYHDFNKKSLKKKFDAAYMLDVYEHVHPKNSDKFLKNICSSLKNKSILITGVPNITAEKYASFNSKKNHINLMSQNELKKKLSKYFYFNFSFGMNDEVLHTGFSSMCHYIIILSINKK